MKTFLSINAFQAYIYVLEESMRFKNQKYQYFSNIKSINTSQVSEVSMLEMCQYSSNILCFYSFSISGIKKINAFQVSKFVKTFLSIKSFYTFPVPKVFIIFRYQKYQYFSSIRSQYFQISILFPRWYFLSINTFKVITF